MDAKEFAKFFGGFSTEKRVIIVTMLLEAGKDGISVNELSRKTDLSVSDIGMAAESLLMMGLLNISAKGESKILSANVNLLNTLFDASYRQLGPGRSKASEASQASGQ